MNRKPEIKLTNLDENTRTCEFELSNVDTAFANALRRIMIAEIPTFAFEHIEFQQNTSPLPDEFIAHRIGLLPLYSERANEFKFPQECDCAGGCPKCRIFYFINVQCESDSRLVTTDDLEFFEEENDHSFQSFVDAGKTIRPVEIPAIPGDEDVPITICKLGKGQVLQVLCTAVKGIAREHAKWSPCSCAAYRMDPRIRVDQHFFARQQQENPNFLDSFVGCCPNGVFKKSGTDEEPILIPADSMKECTFCRQCQEYLETEGFKNTESKIVIEEVPQKFIFKIESTGALAPETIISRAFEILKKKLNDLDKHIRGLTNL